MKTLLQPTVHLVAVIVSVMVNVLSIGAMNAALTHHHTLSATQVQLPSVTVVGKRILEAPAQLAAADAVKPL